MKNFKNKLVKGISWLLIQLVALIECYVIAFCCLGVISSLVFTVASFFRNRAWLNWIFARYGAVILLACIPVAIGIFIYLQVSLYKRPEQPVIMKPQIKKEG